MEVIWAIKQVILCKWNTEHLQNKAFLSIATPQHLHNWKRQLKIQNSLGKVSANANKILNQMYQSKSSSY